MNSEFSKKCDADTKNEVFFRSKMDPENGQNDENDEAEPIQMSTADLKKQIEIAGNPIHQAKRQVGRRKKENTEPVLKSHLDKLKCSICGRIYTRSNKYAHNKTKIHKAYANMNERIKKILLDGED
jgi:hypothetical protein